MAKVDTRPTPVTIYRWPETRTLISQMKGIFSYFWFGPDQAACGCYLLPVDAYAADLSMSPASLDDALAEFTRRGLVDFDRATGEILLLDWFRWYFPSTPAARGAVESAIRSIQSAKLRQKCENLYKTTNLSRKEKVKEKETSKERGSASQGPVGPSLDEETGIHFQPGNQDDTRLLAEIKQHPPELIRHAVTEAKKLEPRHRAWPSAVWRILNKSTNTSGTPAWAMTEDPSAAATAEGIEIEGEFETLED